MFRKIQLKNFRNHKEKTLINDSKILLIQGDNSSGKTSIIEAINICLTKKSFRTNNIKQVVNKEEKESYIIFNFESNGIQNVLKCNIADKTELLLNERKVTALEVKQLLKPIVMQHRTIVEFKYNKKTRISFIDKSISNYFLIYEKIIKDFERIYKIFYENRESQDLLLKETTANKLRELEREIVKLRLEFVDKINSFLPNKTQEVLGFGVYLKYKQTKTQEQGIDSILKSFETIKKDDFIFVVEGDDIFEFKSQGENRMTMIMFIETLIEIDNEKDTTPKILLLDDIFSDLDNNNIEKILKILKNNEATTIVTLPKEIAIPDELNDSIEIAKIGE